MQILYALGFLQSGLSVARKEMKENGISSVFVVDRGRHVQGIVTIDDAMKGGQEGQTIKDVMLTDITIVKHDEYISDLIAKTIESTYPLAVINDEEKLTELILRVHVLSGLASEEVEKIKG